MWLLDKMLRQLVRKGQLVITDHDGKVYRYGDGSGDALAIRFTDKGAALHIARHPQVGAGEAYMDGRMTIEPPHDIRDFVLFIMEQAQKQSGTIKPRTLLRRSLALYLNRHFDVEVTGVSLAPDQVRFANERAEAAGVAHKVRFRLMDYRDLDETFDRITSVGMIEHVGAPHFLEYFAKTNELLADDGVMLTHTIGRRTPPGTTDKFTRKYIFPGGYIPAMSELIAAMERTRWEVADVEVLRYHYAHTIEEWYRRACLHKKEIVELYDERLFRMWQFYLAGAEQSFRHGNMVNFHIQSVKRRDAVPMTRDYIGAEAARLSALDEAPEWHLAGTAAE